MKNLREVNDDILKDWFIYRDEDISALKSDEDKKHWIYFDEIAENILRNVPECNKKYVRQQLHKLENRQGNSNVKFEQVVRLLRLLE